MLVYAWPEQTLHSLVHKDASGYGYVSKQAHATQWMASTGEILKPGPIDGASCKCSTPSDQLPASPWGCIGLLHEYLSGLHLFQKQIGRVWTSTITRSLNICPAHDVACISFTIITTASFPQQKDFCKVCYALFEMVCLAVQLPSRCVGTL